MTLRIPEDREEVFNQLAADVKNNLPNTNPQKEKSFIKAFLVGFAGAFFDLYFQILEAINTFFADTTYDRFLERRAANLKITRNPALEAEGFMTLGGTPGTLIAILTSFINQAGAQYNTQEAKTIVTSIDNVTLLTFTGGIATCSTIGANKLVIDLDVTIAGATPSGLNGLVKVVSVINDDTFTYETTEGGSGTATGTITVESNKAVIPVKSVGVGLDKNQTLNETLIIQTPVVGANNNGAVNTDLISGGADEETDQELRSRLIFRLQNPVTLFNSAQIELLAREFNFVDRVFTECITPDTGQVTIFILKEDNVLPTSSELAQVKNKIVDEIMPCNTAAQDVIVLAPILIPTDFQLTAIIPNTDTMKLSIQNRLIDFFRKEPTPGEIITEIRYLCEIQGTIDLDTGQLLENFVVNTPSGDIFIDFGELATLGTVDFV